MFPDFIHPTFFFKARTQVDTADLTPLTLFVGSVAANYSNQTDIGFTLSRDGYNLEVVGTGFLYSGGVPTEGSVIVIVVKVGNAEAFTISGDPMPLLLFQTSDPAALAATLFAGSDVVDGHDLNDTLYGFTSGDMMSGADGDDLVFGGDGDDQIGGSTGDDKLDGGAGDDWLTGGKGNDKLQGGDGFDIASFSDMLSSVSVDLRKGTTVKAKIGFNEVDKLKGIEGVWGGLGNDKITGNSGDNDLGGNSGNDVIKGNGGDDFLVGFWGLDTLTGGKGSDTFYFDRLAGKSQNWDVITDFTPGADKVGLLRDVFSELDLGVLSANDFLAAPGAFAGAGGKHVVYDTKNGVLYYDPSGDGTAFVYKIAVLKGAPQITASDFYVDSEFVV